LIQTEAQTETQTGLIEQALAGDADAALDLLPLPADALETLLTKRTATEALMLRGWLAVLRGDYAGALGHFDQAHQAHQAERKRTRKRNLYLPGLPGALYLITLLHRGEPDDLAKVHQQVRTCLRASRSARRAAAGPEGVPWPCSVWRASPR
jgi:hypothetical protein